MHTSIVLATLLGAYMVMSSIKGSSRVGSEFYAEIEGVDKHASLLHKSTTATMVTEVKAPDV
jgi:hypothetical protein